MDQITFAEALEEGKALQAYYLKSGVEPGMAIELAVGYVRARFWGKQENIINEIMGEFPTKKNGEKL